MASQKKYFTVLECTATQTHDCFKNYFRTIFKEIVLLVKLSFVFFSFFLRPVRSVLPDHPGSGNLHPREAPV